MKEVRIVGEIDGIITYEEVIRDTVKREDVAFAEEKVNAIRAQIEVESKEMADLIEKIEYAKQILVLADKAKENEVAKEHDNFEPQISITCPVATPSDIVEQ